MADQSIEGLVRELINWESAEVLIDFEPPNPSVIVTGTLPYPMQVRLEPRPEVVAEPEYWPSEVVGYHEAAVEEVESPYSIQRPINELSIGTKGIELDGKDGQQQNLDIELG